MTALNPKQLQIVPPALVDDGQVSSLSESPPQQTLTPQAALVNDGHVLPSLLRG